MPISTTKSIRQHILKIRRGEPFSNKQLLKLGTRTSVDKALSRLVKEGCIQRLARGIFMRPKKSQFIGNIMPEAAKIVEIIAKSHGETIQVHGAEAARRFKLTTQVPTVPVFNTSGPSRELKIGNLTIRLKHISSRKLLHAGKPSGIALSALWYLGKNNVNSKTLNTIQSGLSTKEFETLKNTDMPAWMANAIEMYSKEAAHA